MTARLMFGLALATFLFLPLAACGKVGSPHEPGPASKITYGRVYPPDE
ncbi:hypothetical protein K2X14_01505 [Acetobacter sp. TBRC 12305]|uniref:Lipoprotein n=1 Tax=Acetobacter garciniae TaxID=2817435 RepID=A0A939KPE1_9PROT|nr:hypothetical protein [Acetobacter garciniae]MBO1323829.1 hypothetical protein [Acetobacter garciniae]MBX0343518.1 hypothetical protein [Acetobacter garciniae]